MSRYIDADELIKTLNKEGVPFNEDVNYFILNAPTMRSGKWIWDDEGYHCSECWYHAYGNTLEIVQGEWRYCPNCGTKMVNEDEEMSKVSEMEMAYAEYLND